MVGDVWTAYAGDVYICTGDDMEHPICRADCRNYHGAADTALAGLLGLSKKNYQEDDADA